MAHVFAGAFRYRLGPRFVAPQLLRHQCLPPAQAVLALPLRETRVCAKGTVPGTSKRTSGALVFQLGKGNEKESTNFGGSP